MAIYLKDQVHDKLLLPFPTNTRFDYMSLMEYANTLPQRNQISYQEWADQSRSIFDFDADQSRLYFETCSLHYHDFRSIKTFPGDEGWILKSKIPKMFLVLFLFNQLHSVALSQSSFRTDAEFPVSLEFAHNPLGIQPDPLSRSNTMEDLDSELSDKQTILPFPSRIRDSRNQLAVFWRSNVRKWLTLVFVALYGRDRVIEATSGNTTNFEPRMLDLEFLNDLFLAVGPPEGTDEFKVAIARFRSWYQKKEFTVKSSFDANLKKYPLHQVLANYVSLGATNSTVPFDLLVHLLQFIIIDSPLTFELAQLSNHGKVITTQIHSSPIIVDQSTIPLLLSRKRGRAIIVDPAFSKNRPVLIHRLYDCQLYLFGPTKDIIISNCRNTTIFIPIVTGSISVFSCSGVSITSSCYSFKIDLDSETANNLPNYAYLNIPTRPLVIHSSTNDITFSPVYFGPCDKWYKGYFADLQKNQFDTSINLWNMPICFSEKLFHLVKPHQFHFAEIPIDVAPNQLAPAAESNKFARDDDCNEFMKLLPGAFSTWITETQLLQQKTRVILEQAALKDPLLKSRVEREFQNWLKQSNNIVSVANLVNMTE